MKLTFTLILLVSFISGYAQPENDTLKAKNTDSALFVNDLLLLHIAFNISTDYKYVRSEGANSIHVIPKDPAVKKSAMLTMERLLSNGVPGKAVLKDDISVNKPRNGIQMPPSSNYYNQANVPPEEDEAKRQAEEYETKITLYANKSSCAAYYLKICKQFWGDSWYFRAKALQLTFNRIQQKCK